MQKLSKRYPSSDRWAVHNLDLQINQGEVFGFLGPNGAGKSTTIRMLLNFIQPTKGSALIGGLDSVQDSVAIKSKVGYLSGDFSAYDKMTGREFFAYMSSLQPLKHQAYLQELLKMFQLGSKLRINTLSKGNRQKVGIIQALMHEPEVIILDEPTDGLDPLMQEVFYSLIKDIKKRGGTIFASSHNLAEVRKMCDRVAIIKAGKLVDQKNIAELALEAAQTFDITFKDTPPLGKLKKLPKVRITSTLDKNVTLHIQGDLSDFFAILSTHPVDHITTREVDLEEEFKRFYGENTS